LNLIEFQVLQRNGILINEKKISTFDESDVERDMEKLLQFEKGKLQAISTISDFEKKLAVSAMCGVVKYLEV
jgi:hypothetical protein